jgi:hypothetical protein
MLKFWQSYVSFKQGACDACNDNFTKKKCAEVYVNSFNILRATNEICRSEITPSLLCIFLCTKTNL